MTNVADPRRLHRRHLLHLPLIARTGSLAPLRLARAFQTRLTRRHGLQRLPGETRAASSAEAVAGVPRSREV